MSYPHVTFPITLSVLLYIIIVLLTTYFVWKADLTEYKKRYLLLAFLVMFVPAALRYHVGQDQTSYLSLIEVYDNMFGGDLRYISAAYSFHSVEYSFIIMGFIFRKCPMLVFAIYAFFTQLFMLKGTWYFREEVSPALSIFIYMCTFYLRTYNIFRQSLAVAIVFYSLKYIKQRKFFRFLLCVIFATLFHDSAIVAIILYWLYGVAKKQKTSYFYEKLKRAAPIVCLIFFVAIYNTVANMIPTLRRRLDYYELSEGNSILSIGTLLQCTIFVLYCLSRKTRKIKDKFTQSLLDNTMLWNIVFHFLSFSMSHAARIGLYFTTASYCGIASMHKKGRTLLQRNMTMYDVFILTYCMYKFANTLIVNMFTSLPYSMWFF